MTQSLGSFTLKNKMQTFLKNFKFSGSKVLWAMQFHFISLVLSKDFKVQGLSWAILASDLPSLRIW